MSVNAGETLPGKSQDGLGASARHLPDALLDSTGRNGGHRYSPGGGFSGNTWQARNHWVDVVFVAG